MTTKKQIKANRSNAKKSTGPKTQKGKEISRKNALKHGVFASYVVAQSEDPELFSRMTESLYSRFDPQSTIELRLVDKIAVILWRELRLYQAERNALNVAQMNKAKMSVETELNQPVLLSDEGEQLDEFDMLAFLDRALNLQSIVDRQLYQALEQLDRERERHERAVALRTARRSMMKRAYMTEEERAERDRKWAERDAKVNDAVKKRLEEEGKEEEAAFLASLKEQEPQKDDGS